MTDMTFNTISERLRVQFLKLVSQTLAALGFENERILMAVIWLLRYIALLGTTAVVIPARHAVRETIGVTDYPALSVLFLYFFSLVGWAVYGLYFPSRVLRRLEKWIQACMDIVFVTLFIGLIGNYQSAVWLFYFVPILIMVTLFSNDDVYWVSTLAVVAYAIVFANQRILGQLSGAGYATLESFLVRGAALYVPSLAVWIRGHGTPGSWPDASWQLQEFLHRAADGVYITDAQQRLVYVSPVLTAVHGEDYAGKTCYEYLASQPNICDWCPIFTETGHSISLQPHQTELVDRRGRKYRAEISHHVVESDKPGRGWAVGFVKALDQATENRKLVERFRRQRLIMNLDQIIDERLAAHAMEPAEIAATFARKAANSVRHYLGDGTVTVRLIQVKLDKKVLANVGTLDLKSAHLAGEDVDPDGLSIESLAYRTGRVQECYDLPAALADGRLSVPMLSGTSSVKIAVCFPVVVGLEVHGVVTYCCERQDIERKNVPLAHAYLNLLALPLGDVEASYKALTYEPLARQRWMVALRDIGIKLASFMNRDALFDYCVATIKDLLQAETASIFLLQSGAVRRIHAVGITPGWLEDEHYGIGEYVTGQVFKGQFGQVIRINDMDSNVHKVKYLKEYQAELPSHQVKHLLAVPLNGRQGTYGALRVVNRVTTVGEIHHQGFTDEDNDFLVTIASMLGVAIELADLYTQERERLQRNVEIRDRANEVVSHVRLQDMIEQILEGITKVVPCDSVSFQLLHEGGTLEVVAGRNLPPEVYGVCFPPEDRFPNTRVMRERRPIRVGNVGQDFPVFREPHYHVMQINSWMGAPIVYLDEPIGMLSFERRQPEAFTVDDEDRATIYAKHIAPMLWNARYHELEVALQRRENALQASRLQALQHFLDAAERIAVCEDPEEALVVAAKEGSRVFRAQECSIFLVRSDERGRQIAELRASTLLPRQYWASRLSLVTDEPKQGITGWVIKTGLFLNLAGVEIVDHVAHNGEFVRIREELGGPTHSLLAVPILDRDKCIGEVKFENRIDSPGTRFDIDHVELAKVYAAIVGMAIKRARLAMHMRRVERELHLNAGLIAGQIEYPLDILLVGPHRSRLSDAIAVRLAITKRRANAIHSSMATLFQDVREPILARKGLLTALREFARGLDNVETSLPRRFSMRLSEPIEEALYGIARLALYNVEQHSGGQPDKRTSAKISLKRIDIDIVFEITNEGLKCPPNRLTSDSIGIRQMRDAARAIGAKCTLTPLSEGGVCVRVVLPYPE